MADTIPTRRLGGLEVGAQGLGCMSLSPPYGALGDPADAFATIRRALDLGVTLLDTADIYGESEELVGQALAGRRDQAGLATKLGIVFGADRQLGARGDAAYVRQCCERSLRRLGVDHIDLCCYQHRVDLDRPGSRSAAAWKRGR